MADADFFKTRSDFTGGQRRSLYGGNIAAYMICAVTEIYSVGNHVLFAAQVVDRENTGKESMIYHEAKKEAGHIIVAGFL